MPRISQTYKTSLYDKHMQTHANHDKFFYKPVTVYDLSLIMVNDRLLTDDVKVLNAWADHFESMGRPLEDDSSKLYVTLGMGAPGGTRTHDLSCHTWALYLVTNRDMITVPKNNFASCCR